MSLDLLITGISLACQVWQTYETINGAPSEVADAAKEIKSMSGYMEDVKKLIQDINVALPAEREAKITEIVEAANAISTEANILLKKWRNEAGTGPMGLQWRISLAAKLKFTFMGDMETLKQLGDKARAQSNKLSHELQVIHIWLDHVRKPGGSGLAAPGQRPRSKSRNSGVRILFVDPHNMARSRVAEGLTLLIGSWTVCTGGKWRVSAARSAGFFVQKSPDMTNVINSLQLLYSEDYVKSIGGKPPSDVPLAAVFDNSLYKHPVKPRIRAKIAAQGTKGLGVDTFAKYDYVLAFTEREFANLNMLRDALRQRCGSKAVPLGRTKVVHLGSYLNNNKYQTPVEIVNTVHAEARDEWNAKASQIKYAIKQFLKKELGWAQGPGSCMGCDRMGSWEKVMG